MSRHLEKDVVESIHHTIHQMDQMDQNDNLTAKTQTHKLSK